MDCGKRREQAANERGENLHENIKRPADYCPAGRFGLSVKGRDESTPLFYGFARGKWMY